MRKAGRSDGSGGRFPGGKYLAAGAALVLIASYLFYRSLIPAILLSPVSFVVAGRLKERESAKWSDALRRQYADGLRAFSSALKAGYAPENAVSYAAEECRILYGETAPITQEYEKLEGAVGMNRSLEEGFQELAERAELSEAELFAEVFAVARRSGGNLVRIVEETCRVLEEHIRTQEEIRTALRAREMEQQVMMAAPLLLLLFFTVFSPDYLTVMYETLFGRAVMTVCLGIYLLACFLSDRILEAERVG